MLGEAGPIAGAAAQPKRLAILALLARAGPRGMTRDKIVSYLWPDADDERGRRALANSVSALRRDLASDDPFAGGNDLRLDPDVITSDVEEFDTAVAAGDLDRAAALYEGPFLDGFRVAGAPEFERWADAERTAIAYTYATVVEQLARAAEIRHDPTAALAWWRRLAAHDPLNARHALGLMGALEACGDRTGALRHAQIYEALVEQELELPPDREVVAFAERLRRDQTRGAARPVVPNVAVAPEAGEFAPTVEVSPAPERSGAVSADRAGSSPVRRERREWVLVVVAVVAVAGLGITLWSAARGRAPDARAGAGPRVLAVGRIADYRRGESTELARPLADMLATNLARTATLRVVSTARMYELLARDGGPHTSMSAIMNAARGGGATLLVDGALHTAGNGALRLDVQLVDLASGRVVAAHTVTGDDPLTLADSGTTRLLASLGTVGPARSVADVTTRSVSAYRLYEEGLREYFAGRTSAARRLFEAALAEDSAFAMAAFYRARSAETWGVAAELAPHARRLAHRTTDRERLQIEAWYASLVSSPNYKALAETLAVRYPHDVDGQLHLGRATLAANQAADAIRILERVVERDSVVARGEPLPCSSCEALELIVNAYESMDSLGAALRTIDRWTRLRPSSRAAWNSRAVVLAMLGRDAEALQAAAQFRELSAEPDSGQLLLAQLHLIGERFEKADSLLRQLAATGPAARRSEAWWTLTTSLRHQGRLADALQTARVFRQIGSLVDARGESTLESAVPEAQVLFELGRLRESAALFDSLSRGATPRATATMSRGRVWWLTHAASALGAMGDTGSLPSMADTIETRGTGSMLHRDRRLHHHVRGLLFVARGQSREASAEFEQALFSDGAAFTRTNYELAKLYLQLGRPRDAVRVLGPVLRGGLEGSTYFLTRTEAHELLARSWEAVGGALAEDSAAVHYRSVVHAWSRGDAPFQARARAARTRLVALGR